MAITIPVKKFGKNQKHNRMPAGNNPPAEKNYPFSMSHDDVLIAENKAKVEAIIEKLCSHYSRIFSIFAEHIDNTASNFIANGIKDGLLTFVIRNIDNTTLGIEVIDNGTGIKYFVKAITLGDTSARETALNAHGFFIPNLSYTAQDFHLESVYRNMYYAVDGQLYEGVSYQKHRRRASEMEHGTKFEYKLPFAYLAEENKRVGESTGARYVKHFSGLIDCLMDSLNHYFGHHAADNGYTIKVRAIDTDGSEILRTVTRPDYMVETVSYVDANGVHTAEADFPIPARKGGGWVMAHIRFVKITKESHSKLGYMQRTAASQVIHVSFNGRLITKLCGLRQDIVQHNTSNGFTAFLDLDLENADQGPETEVAKTGLVDTIKNAEFINLVYSKFPDIAKYFKNNEPVKYNEVTFVKRWSDHLTANGCANEVLTKVPDESSQQVDVLNYSNETLYEVKFGQASTAAVHQLTAYVAAFLQEGHIPFKHAVVTAESCSDNVWKAIKAQNLLLAPFGIQIEFQPLSDVAGEFWKEFRAQRDAAKA